MKGKQTQQNKIDVDSLVSLERDELTKRAAELSPEQAAAAVLAFQADAENNEGLFTKTLALFEGFRDNRQIESAAASLSLAQLLSLFTGTYTRHPPFPVAPLFVGLSPQLFSQMMLCATPKLLKELRPDSVEEPLQHHLTLLCHELANESELLATACAAFYSSIEQRDSQALESPAIAELSQQIDLQAQRYHAAEKMAASSLTLAWNSGRSDLIERLMALKELLSRRSKSEINAMRTALEAHLNKIYNGLDDSDLAIEALAPLKLWYLKDYWAVGLLPHIASEELLDAAAASSADGQGDEDRKALLYAAARDTLAQAGLKQVGDFKKQHIYSKKCLQEYLRRSK